jgi:hypothetical protein
VRGGPLYDVQRNVMSDRDVRREFGDLPRAHLEDHQMGQRPVQRGRIDLLVEHLSQVRIATLQQEDVARRAARESEWAREWELMERETMARIRRDEEVYFRDSFGPKLRPLQVPGHEAGRHQVPGSMLPLNQLTFGDLMDPPASSQSSTVTATYSQNSTPTRSPSLHHRSRDSHRHGTRHSSIGRLDIPTETKDCMA